jgi:multiple sugar transport system permease protein
VDATLDPALLDRPARAAGRPRPRRWLPSVLFYGVGAGLAALFVFPVLWSLFTSLMPAAEASTSPPTYWPSRLTLENYLRLASYGDGILHYVWNSTAVAALTVSWTVVLATLAGYGFSRFHFPGRNVLFVGILATLMIPFQSILTPLFVLLRTLHLQNTLAGLALVYTTFQLPFSVFMMRNSFDAIPREIEEAAMLDGCSPVKLLLRVMLRLVSPGVVTVALFAFFASWNELLAALILQTDAGKFTLPVMLLNARSGSLGSINWGVMQAGISVGMLPCAVLFLLMQRYYISGLIAGAVKA